MKVNEFRIGNFVDFPFHNEMVEVIGLPILADGKQGMQAKTKGTVLCEVLKKTI